MTRAGSDEPTFNRVSSGALREATGRGWDDWLEELDAAGAEGWDHKRIVSHLEREHPDVSGWWHQTITVGYEKARGRRVVGQTADAGFQVGVQRTVPLRVDEAWALLTERPESWLGEGDVELTPGASYEADDDAHGRIRGEVRVVRPGDRLRMTWQPDGWTAPATLQISLVPASSGRTAVRVHLEKLPDAEAREAMRAHWREVLDRISGAI